MFVPRSFHINFYVGVLSFLPRLVLPREQDKAMPCKSIIVPNFVCRRGEQCEFSHKQTNLTFFLDCLNSATKSLDICIFQLTCNEIAQAVGKR